MNDIDVHQLSLVKPCTNWNPRERIVKVSGAGRVAMTEGRHLCATHEFCLTPIFSDNDAPENVGELSELKVANAAAHLLSQPFWAGATPITF